MSLNESSPPTAPMVNTSCVNAMTTVITAEDCDFISKVALVFFIISILFIVWGLFSNIILLVIIFSNGPKMRTLPNIFISNMAFLGILFLVIVAGGNLVILGQVAFQVKLIDDDTRYIFIIQVFISVASFTTLVVLALDRFSSIVFPLRSKVYRTKKRACICCGFVWIISGICVIPLILGGGSVNLFDNYSTPAFRDSMIVFFTIAYIVPIVIITLCYAAIVKVIWCNPVNKNFRGEEQKRRLKQRIQVLKTIGIVVVSYLLHYGYFFAVLLWIAEGGHVNVSARVSNSILYSAILAVYLNTCTNPVVYALHQKAFRPYVYKLLCPRGFKFRRPQEGALRTDQQQPEDLNSRVTGPSGQDNGLSPNESSGCGNGSTETSLTTNGVEECRDKSQGYSNDAYVDECDQHKVVVDAQTVNHTEAVTLDAENDDSVCIQLDEIEPTES